MPSNSPADSTGPIPRPYTPDDVVQQSLISFGQATDYLRVNRDAAQAVVNLMRDTVQRSRVHERWDTEAVQVLERLRAIGRSAALSAIHDGRTVINRADVEKATAKVVQASKSDNCAKMSVSAFPSSL